MKIDYKKHIWEGWTIQDFIDELDITFDLVKDNFKTEADVKKWAMENQPYYKKYIPEVVQHFYKKLKIK
jgi:hypothetical protein